MFMSIPHSARVFGACLYFYRNFYEDPKIFLTLPWKQILAVGCGVLLLLLVISLCMIRMVRHINIIDELKKSD